MSLRKTAVRLLALASLAAAPLYAQTPPGANTTMGTNPNASHPNAPAASMQHDQMSTTSATTTSAATHRARARRTSARTTSKASVYTDATRLGTLLRDAQTNVTIPAATWTTVAGEATTLANRVYARTSGDAHRLAADARTHVRLMATAARAGDAAGARSHASEALPFVHQLIDWSMPPRM